MVDLYELSFATILAALGHTIVGPDHYVPFVAMSKVGNWSLRKTLAITSLCGVAHVLSSVLIGLVGIAFAVAVAKLEFVEAIRGDLAGWLLVTFGLLYFTWGVAQAIRNRPHEHLHAHADGTVHAHAVNYAGAALAQPAEGAARRRAMTPWVLFTIFLFGPCEPLIPMVMYPASLGSMWGVAWVTLLFGLTTVATMLTAVLLMHWGVNLVRLNALTRYGHALAGFVVLACGCAIKYGF